MTMMTDSEVREYLRKQIKERYRNIKTFAIERGVSDTYIYGVLTKVPIPDGILEEFGLKRRVEVVRTVTYEVEP